VVSVSSCGSWVVVFEEKSKAGFRSFFVFFLILGFVVGLGFKEWREIHLVVLRVKKRPVRGSPKVERDRGCSHLKVGTKHCCQTGGFGV
jgi:hypothetical protein